MHEISNKFFTTSIIQSPPPMKIQFYPAQVKFRLFRNEIYVVCYGRNVIIWNKQGDNLVLCQTTFCYRFLHWWEWCKVSRSCPVLMAARFTITSVNTHDLRVNNSETFCPFQFLRVQFKKKRHHRLKKNFFVVSMIKQEIPNSKVCFNRANQII